MSTKPSLRDLIESTGVKLDSTFYDQSNPNYERNQQLVREASNTLYGNVGANMDARDWSSIMQSSNPLQAAKEGLRAMYSDPTYLKANTENLIAQGYVPEQADYTYRQMQERVGSTYDPNWTAGSRFAGTIDTDGYLKAVNSFGGDQQAQARYQEQQLARWRSATPGLVTGGGSGVVGGSGTGVSGGGVVDTGGSSSTGGLSGGATPGNTNTGGQTGFGNSAAVWGPDGTMYSSAAAAMAAGVTNYTFSKPMSAPQNTGLISGADTLANIPTAATGNTNPGGLISGANQQLFNAGPARVALPGGVRNPFAI